MRRRLPSSRKRSTCLFRAASTRSRIAADPSPSVLEMMSRKVTAGTSTGYRSGPAAALKSGRSSAPARCRCSPARPRPAPASLPHTLVLPFCRLTLRAKKPVSREKLPDFFGTWGDWIKARRPDLKLSKHQLSVNLSVSDITIYLWERNKVRPSLAQIPKIIEFLRIFDFMKKTGTRRLSSTKKLEGGPDAEAGP
jgi:DNA-binding XRE family transcriptional regulator